MSSLIIGLIAVLGFWITFRTSTAANREVIEATKNVSLEGIAISAASKQAEFRQQWIENLRKAMAELLAQIVTLMEHDKFTDLVPTERYQLIVHKIEYIELLLNMNEEPSKALSAAIHRLLDLTLRPRDKRVPSDIYAARKNVAALTRHILKAEWDKLRTELKTLKQKET